MARTQGNAAPMPLNGKTYLPLIEAVKNMELSRSDVCYLVEHCRLQTYVHLHEEHALIGRIEADQTGDTDSVRKKDHEGDCEKDHDLASVIDNVVGMHSSTNVGMNGTDTQTGCRPSDEVWQWGQMPTHLIGDLERLGRCKVERTGLFFDLAPVHVVTASRVLREGMARVTHFGDGQRFVTIPTESPNAAIEIEDLIVFRAVFDRICGAHGVEKKSSPWIDIECLTIENCRERPQIFSFSDFVFRGEKIHFGQMQRDVLQFLFDERDNENDGWVEGARILQKVGSNSRQLSQLFKHKNVWRDLIEWNNHKRFRLHPNFLRDYDIKLNKAA